MELVKIETRLLNWRDLPFLFQNRDRLLSLDSALNLTRGNPVGLGALLTHLHPSLGPLTVVTVDAENQCRLIGQMNYTNGDRSARITYLLPYDDCTSSNMLGLLDGLAAQAGSVGALNLLAELDETSPAFENMRRAGLSVYGWQRIWKLPFQNDSYGEDGSLWQDVQPIDEIPIRNLYQCLVPPLAQSVDPLPMHRSRGMVFRQAGEVMGYIEFTAGPRGIYLFPLIHPDVENVVKLLKGLAPCLAPLLLRPVYMAVRFYQAWLEPSLELLEGKASPRQALLVKRLAISQRVLASNQVQVVREARHAEPTARMANHITQKTTDQNDLKITRR